MKETSIQRFKRRTKENPKSLAGILVGALAPLVVTATYCITRDAEVSEAVRYFALASAAIPVTAMAGKYLGKYLDDLN